MIIPYIYEESFSTTQDGRTIALYIAKQWRDKGKNVRIDETTTGIKVISCNASCLSEDDWLIEMGE